MNGFVESRKALCRGWCLTLLAATRACRYNWNCNQIDLLFYARKVNLRASLSGSPRDCGGWLSQSIFLSAR